MNIKDQKIGVRLSIGFGLLLLFLLALGTFTLFRLNSMERDITRVADDRIPKVIQSYTIIDQLNTVARALRNMILVQDSARVLQEDARIDEAAKIVKENLSKLEESLKSGEDRQLLQDLSRAREGYIEIQSRVRQEIKAGRKAEAVALLLGDLRTRQTAYFDAIRKLIDSQQTLMNTDAKGAMETAANIKSAIWWLSSVAIIVGILLTIVIIRSITGPVSEATNVTQRLARGETAITFSEFTKDETGTMLRSMKEMVEAVKRMSADVDLLSNAAVEGRLGVRADSDRHQGDFRRIVTGVNETLDSLVGFLDNMPIPCMVINKDFQVMYMNKAGGSLGNTTGDQLVRNKQRCYDFFRTSDCKTDKCACAVAMRNDSEATSQTDAHPGGHNLDIQYSGTPIRDRSGQVIGAFEVVSDLTAIKKAARLASKIADYQQIEIERLDFNLKKISAGDLNVELTLAEADADTNETKDKFNTIANGVKRSVEAIRSLVADAEMLSKAAVEGRLETRAEASKHQGDYRKIIQGVNDTLDSVINPVNEVMRVMGALEQGDLTCTIQQEYQGKLQQLRNAVNNTVKKLADTVAEIGQGANTLASSAEELTATSASMATGSEQMTHQANTAAAATEQATANVKNMAAGIEQISSNSNTVASASEEVSVNLNTVGAAVEQVSSNMKVVATTSERMTMAVNSVATAIEEMSVSLNEVAKSSGQAATVASRAAMNAGNAAGIVDKLGQSAQEIGKVVDMIKGIAAQTNLLALNATIEAASAGEAGKGFAVVANEVKELAKQTAAATEDIRAQVEGMQGNTAQVVKAIDEIVQIINQINDISGTIAAAVEEQTATTNEISKNVGDAARGANDVSRNVQQAAAGANEVSRNVQEAAKGVGEIARNINQLAAGANDVARNAGEAAKGMNDVSKNVIQVSGQAKSTTQGAGDTNNAAKELARLAERLQGTVKKFKL